MQSDSKHEAAAAYVDAANAYKKKPNNQGKAVFKPDPWLKLVSLTFLLLNFLSLILKFICYWCRVHVT